MRSLSLQLADGGQLSGFAPKRTVIHSRCERKYERNAAAEGFARRSADIPTVALRCSFTFQRGLAKSNNKLKFLQFSTNAIQVADLREQIVFRPALIYCRSPAVLIFRPCCASSMQQRIYWSRLAPQPSPATSHEAKKATLHSGRLLTDYLLALHCCLLRIPVQFI